MSSPQDNYLESSEIEEILIKSESSRELKIECLEIQQANTNGNSNQNQQQSANKCGEIFVSNDGAFQVNCKFCSLEFKRVKNFIDHTLNKHFWFDSSSASYADEFLGDFQSDSIGSNKDNNGMQICEINLDNNLEIEHADMDNNLDELPLEFLNENNNENIVTRINHTNCHHESDNDKNSITSESKETKPNYYQSNTAQAKIILKCKECQRKFKRKSDLTRHMNCHKKKTDPKVMKKKNDTQKNYVCEICGNSYRSNYFLKEHLRVHSGERPYKCDMCPQTFAKRNHMLFHVRYHLNDKRFECQYCGKGFVESTKRKLHEMIHTNDFPFECEFCDKKFRCRSKLNVHLKRHINDRIHKCDLCEKRFFDINLLRGHQAVHSDDKPFACEVCPARFPRKGALRLHKQLHSEAKSYVCKICGKSFAQYNGIYSHMKSHGIKYSSAYEKGELDGVETVTEPEAEPEQNSHQGNEEILITVSNL